MRSEREMAEAVLQAQREILWDVESGVVPDDVRDFSHLHDFVDANEYGGMCDERADWTTDEIIPFQDLVNDWIVAGYVGFRLSVDGQVFVPRLEEDETSPFTLCPMCSRVLDGSWADDGEADRADWFFCDNREYAQEYGGGCGARGAYVRANDTGVTQNGVDLFLDAVESEWYGLTKGELWLDPVRHGDEHDPELVATVRGMRALLLQNPDESLTVRQQALRVAEALMPILMGDVS